ncbi:uncharacterized protein LOC119189043 [Manduca sexta]|uniref:uncharacterized protein LOC119189043 n=1 Tax=Manduca sexta TaxID=7130 RepID=UPI0018909F55|nr:uncharacterized protein LOC119189043 [Manduca sexta]
MQAMSANASAPRAPQRSPFAIQELLGLSEARESRETREARERFLEREPERVLNLSEREPRPYAPQFPLPASMASRVAYAAAFNAQAAVAAAFLPGPPLLHAPPGFPQIKSPYSPTSQPHLTGKWLRAPAGRERAGGAGGGRAARARGRHPSCRPPSPHTPGFVSPTDRLCYVLPPPSVLEQEHRARSPSPRPYEYSWCNTDNCDSYGLLSLIPT